MTADARVPLRAGEIHFLSATLVAVTAGLAVSAATGEMAIAFALVFAVSALLSALLPGVRLAWGIGVVLLVGVLAWAAHEKAISALHVWAALIPSAASLWAVVLSVHGVESFTTETKRTRRTRALILSISALLVAAIALGAVTLGQRASRAARQARANDELGLASEVIAGRLAAASPPSTDAPQSWVPIVIEAARLTGRSVYLFAPDESSHRLMLGAHWDPATEPIVTTVRTESQVPATEMQALKRYLADPFYYSSSQRTWMLPMDSLPFGTPVFSGAAGSTESRTVALGKSGSEFTGRYILVLSPKSTSEWWSLETRLEYTRIVLTFVVWSVILVVGTEALILRLVDERQELRTLLSVNEARETIRRDAHDRIFNRLAGVARALEEPGADESTARGAAFEIRSTVDYLQTMLRDGSEAPDPSEEITLESQLAEIADSARRIWGLDMAVMLDPSLKLPASLAWDVQCLIDEALSNAGEHSGATRVLVKVQRTDDGSGDQVHFSVSDNGHWQQGSAPSSTGLRGMRSRVAHLGGTIDVVAVESGTVVEARIPI